MKLKITDTGRLQDLPISTWVVSDARSVNAMLNGQGDGRHVLYIVYIYIQKRLTPSLSAEELARGFTHTVATNSWLHLDGPEKTFGNEIMPIASKCVRLAFFMWRNTK